jgi:hypothetical protein
MFDSWVTYRFLIFAFASVGQPTHGTFFQGTEAAAELLQALLIKGLVVQTQHTELQPRLINRFESPHR